MKIYNLTDMPTEELEKSNLVNKPIVIWKYIVQPGGCVDVEESNLVLRDCSFFVSIGALAVNSLPAKYVVAKDRLRKSGGRNVT